MKKPVLLINFITPAIAASAQVTSTFDTDADGWTLVNVGELFKEISITWLVHNF